MTHFPTNCAQSGNAGVAAAEPGEATARREVAARQGRAHAGHLPAPTAHLRRHQEVTADHYAGELVREHSLFIT